jgi:Cu+-exporting ATPase
MAGTKPRKERADQFAFLDLPEIQERFIQFRNEQQIKVTLSLPSIHCSSCIYLLEHFHKIEPRVLQIQVHFARKEAAITFSPDLPFSELASLLQYIGYEPDFSRVEGKSKKRKYTFLFQLGIAGFAFGSIMLWSTPEYFGLGQDNPNFRNFTSVLSFLVSIPVLLFSAKDYFISAFKALRSKVINLDVPITIGIIALYLQSLIQIFSWQGAGYMDSFSGFIFFLLIGKWFQSVTYSSLAFDRDYTSFFPVAVQRMEGQVKKIVSVEQLLVGDIMLIRNEEIIPCDSFLLSEEAYVDYSFVTGEAVPTHIFKGDLVYAGGQIKGLAAQLEVKALTNRSHLTQLWNETRNKIPSNQLIRYQDRIAQYFLVVLLLIALGSGLAWYFIDTALIFKVVVSVLIVACPCALALSAPFTLGNTLRALGKSGLYLKNVTVVEALTSIDTIVLDKTGTLTDPNSYQIDIKYNDLDERSFAILVNLARHSTHPFSRAFAAQNENIQGIDLEHITETKGEGMTGVVGGESYQLGSAQFTGLDENMGNELFLKHNDKKAQLVFKSSWRAGAIQRILNQFQANHCFVLSGDQNLDAPMLIDLGFKSENLHFNLKPQDKAQMIQKWQQEGKKILFIGDGLNDVGALGLAEVGIALSEDMFRFTPSSDAILDAKYLNKLPELVRLGRYAKRVLQICLAFSLSYNVFGLSFAVTGQLTPLFAAIFMPVSSITIVALSTILVQLKFRRLFKS